MGDQIDHGRTATRNDGARSLSLFPVAPTHPVSHLRGFRHPHAPKRRKAAATHLGLAINRRCQAGSQTEGHSFLLQAGLHEFAMLFHTLGSLRTGRHTSSV